MLKDDILLNVFNFQQRLLFAYRSSRRYTSVTQMSEVTWQTIHKHVAEDTFCSKKSSSALHVHEQEAFGITTMFKPQALLKVKDI